MDRFELIMSGAHNDQWINVWVFVNEAFPLGQFFFDPIRAFGWCVPGFASHRISNVGARKSANVHVAALDICANFKRGPCCQRTAFDALESCEECLAVTQSFFGIGGCMNF